MKNSITTKIRIPMGAGWLAGLTGLTLLAAGVPDGWSQIVYRAGFEPPTFTAGLPLAGQDGWIVGLTPEGPLSPNAAIISTDLPRQGRQSVQVFGADLVH